MPDLPPAERRALLSRMQNSVTPATEKRSRFKGCIYGPNGPGKTTAAVALAKKLIRPGQKIIFVDTNEGWLSLRNFPSLMQDVEVLPYESMDQLYVLGEAIYHQQGIFADVGAVILDDADFMTEDALNVLWHKRVAEGTSRLDPDKPERPEYLKLGFQVGEVLGNLYKNTPDVHVIMTAHLKEKKTVDGTVIKTFPGFNPALSDAIQGKLLAVCYMTAKEERVQGGDRDIARYTRQVQVHPTSMIEAKSRIGLTKIRYDIASWINEVTDWVLEGGEEEDEADAVKRDIQTRKVSGEDDIPGVIDDDAPMFVESEQV